MSALPAEAPSVPCIRTRVAVRDGRIVRLKRCRECQREKVVSADKSESEFYVRWRPLVSGGLSPGWGPICMVCVSAEKRRQYAEDPEAAKRRAQESLERLRSDPERIHTRRLQRREAARRRWERMTPEQREARRAAARAAHTAWVARILAEDPGYFSRERRAERATARAAAEVKIHLGRPRVDAAPFRAWLLAYGGALGISQPEVLARELGVVPTRIRRVLAGQKRVALDVVDRALLSAVIPVCVDGREVLRLADLYE